MNIKEIFTSRRIRPEPPSIVLSYEQISQSVFDVHVYSKTRQGKVYLNTVRVGTVPAGSYETLIPYPES